MRRLYLLVLAIFLAGCYTQLKVVGHEQQLTEREYASNEDEYVDEDSVEYYEDDLHVYHHYSPAADPYFDYLYYDDPFWYHHTRFYLGYDWYYSRWYRPIWHRPWWSWSYSYLDYYNPWYSWYYPAYYYPWGGYDPYPYVIAGNYGKRSFSRRGTTVSRRTPISRDDGPTSSSQIARKRSASSETKSTVRAKVGKSKRKKSAIRKRGSSAKRRTNTGTVTKSRSGSSSAGSRSRSSGSSVTRSAPSRSSSPSSGRSSSSGSSRGSSKRR